MNVSVVSFVLKTSLEKGKRHLLILTRKQKNKSFYAVCLKSGLYQPVETRYMSSWLMKERPRVESLMDWR